MAMRVNTAWLLEYLTPRCTHEELLEALPRIGLEIESAHALAEELAAVKVGFVRKKQALAEGMSVCEVEIAKNRRIPVVCAAEHPVEVGWGVPVAPAGVRLPTEKTIAEGNFHGAASQGMICLDGEMGLIARGTGMQHFEDEALLGAPFSEAAQVTGHLVELNVLPNRPDFLGLLGIAREGAALLGLEVRYPDAAALSRGGGAPVAAEIETPEWCARYMVQAMRGVRVGKSPPWLSSVLLTAGMRPINNVVDITNFILYEWGQPLHAFDADRLRGKRIVVRKMRPGESLELLTGKALDAGDGARMVIADAERPVALAGIMGGRSTQTSDGTTNLLIEAAHFDRVQIRQTVRNVDLGMEKRGTESSYRFERGTDPNRMLEGAMDRACALIGELAGGKVEGGLVDVYPRKRERRTVRLSTERTSRYLGMPVTAETIRKCLTRLGMECSAGGEEIEVRVPTWRADVDDPVVLIEDVARMLGYDQVPVAVSGTPVTVGTRSQRDRLRMAIGGQLAAGGFYECRNPALESAASSAWLGAPAEGLTIANEDASELTRVLRRTLLAGLLESAQRNVRRAAPSLRLFEIDRAFEWGGKEIVTTDRVGAVMGGAVEESNWRATQGEMDFYHLKGAIEDLLAGIGAKDVRFEPVEAPPFVEGGAAAVLVGGRRAGVAGEIDPAMARLSRLPYRLYGFELDLAALEDGFAAIPSAAPISDKPPVIRDLAVVLPSTVIYEDVRRAIVESAGPMLESVRLVDQYQGPQVPAGRVSLAFSLVFRAADRTLTADEAADAMAGIVAALGTRFGAELRA